MVINGKLTAGHARAILTVKETGQQVTLAKKIIGQGMSVRDTEVASASESRTQRTKGIIKDPDMMMVQQRFEEYFNTKVRVIKQKSGGRIEVSFHDDEELSRIMELLGLI
jgi:ParB family chromosome partitioning protein